MSVKVAIHLQLQNGSIRQFPPGNFAGGAITKLDFERFRRIFAFVLEQLGEIPQFRCLFALENRQELREYIGLKDRFVRCQQIQL